MTDGTLVSDDDYNDEDDDHDDGKASQQKNTIVEDHNVQSPLNILVHWPYYNSFAIFLCFQL